MKFKFNQPITQDFMKTEPFPPVSELNGIHRDPLNLSQYGLL